MQMLCFGKVSTMIRSLTEPCAHLDDPRGLDNRFMRYTVLVCDLSALSVRYWLTKAVTGNGELGFDSGEGA
jgi:hypothetical protein